MSLAAKLIAATIALLVITVGAAGYYSVRSIEELGREEAVRRRADGEAAMKTQAELIVKALAGSASAPLIESNTGYLGLLVEKALKDDPRIEWLIVLDKQTGKVAASAGHAPDADKIDAQMTRELENASAVVHRVDPHDKTRHTFAANVLANDTVMGQVHLGISTRSLEDALVKSVASAQARARGAVRQLSVVAGVIALLGMLIAAWQGLRITRPLKALTVQAGAIAGGDFQQRVHVSSRDEIGQLASTFNTMAESLGALLQEMAGKASMERELELARSVQQLMSPPGDLVQTGGGAVVMAGHCEPASQCGGDWWTYRELSGGRVLLVIGDVTGHGMPAAMIAATARGAVVSLAMTDDRAITPLLVLEAVDNAIRDVGNDRLLMTCFAMVMNPEAGLIQYANAGHNFPYIGRVVEDGAIGELGVLAVNGNPLGNPQICVRAGQVTLRPGHLIVLSTDGLADRLSASGERFGDKRLRKLLQKHRVDLHGPGVDALRDKIIGEVRSFAGQHPADDDTTLVVCRYMGASAQLDRRSKSHGAVA